MWRRQAVYPISLGTYELFVAGDPRFRLDSDADNRKFRRDAQDVWISQRRKCDYPRRHLCYIPENNKTPSEKRRKMAEAMPKICPSFSLGVHIRFPRVLTIYNHEFTCSGNGLLPGISAALQR